MTEEVWSPWYWTRDQLPELGDWVQVEGHCECKELFTGNGRVAGEGMVTALYKDGFELTQPPSCPDLGRSRWRRRSLSEPQSIRRTESVDA